MALNLSTKLASGHAPSPATRTRTGPSQRNPSRSRYVEPGYRLGDPRFLRSRTTPRIAYPTETSASGSLGTSSENAIRPSCFPFAPCNPFNGGPDKHPAKRTPPMRNVMFVGGLQWRAGQTPSQTAVSRCELAGACRAFNGGPGKHPAKPDARAFADMSVRHPSMEGRAIARPNCPCASPGCRSRRTFNGGPGNCPAKPFLFPRRQPGIQLPSMEGRAIARPNQMIVDAIGHLAQPSMEGRAIARPNAAYLRAEADWQEILARPNGCMRRPISWIGPPSMEGRAIARPNPVPYGVHIVTVAALQWRAGQLPSQTRRILSATPTRLAAFNGGPGNCPAKPIA